MSFYIVRQWMEIGKVLCTARFCIKVTNRHYPVNSVRLSGYFYEQPYLKFKKNLFLRISEQVQIIFLIT